MSSFHSDTFLLTWRRREMDMVVGILGAREKKKVNEFV